MVSEVIKCFLRELNGTACYKYIKDELKLTKSFETVEKIYYEIRDVIVKYYNVVYQSEILGPKDSHKNYSADESLLSHTNEGEQIWILGIIDKISKDFRLNLTLDRNQETLKNFITRYVEPGNTIVTDGLSGYDFLSNNEDYIHDIHLSGG